MSMSRSCLLLAVCVAATLLVTADAIAVTHFNESFRDGDGWRSRWVESDPSATTNTMGRLETSYGQWHGDDNEDIGMRTTEDYRAYLASAVFRTPYSSTPNFSKGDFVLQYSIKHEQEIECGGGFVKLFAGNLDQKKLNHHTAYVGSFGPDLCGTLSRHVVFQFAFPKLFMKWGKNVFSSPLFELKKRVRMIVDHFTHFYTLHLYPQGQELHFALYIDGVIARYEGLAGAQGEEVKGNLGAALDIAGKLKDGRRHHNYNAVAAFSASLSDLELPTIQYVGLELWQVRAGSIFDDFYIGTNIDEALKEIQQRRAPERTESERRGFEEFNRKKEAEIASAKRAQEERRRRTAQQASDAAAATAAATPAASAPSTPPQPVAVPLPIQGDTHFVLDELELDDTGAKAYEDHVQHELPPQTRGPRASDNHEEDAKGFFTDELRTHEDL